MPTRGSMRPWLSPIESVFHRICSEISDENAGSGGSHVALLPAQ